MSGYDTGKVLTIVLGIVGTLITSGVIAMVTMTIGMSNRLTGIETTLNENREIRERNDRILDSRIERLERDLYSRRGAYQER